MLDSFVFGSKKKENYTKGAHLNGGEHNVLMELEYFSNEDYFYEREKKHLDSFAEVYGKQRGWKSKYEKQIRKKRRKKNGKNEKNGKNG